MAKKGAHGLPWYRSDRDQWFVTLDGKKVGIRDGNGDPVRGPNNRAAAVRALSGGPAPKLGTSVRAVLQGYLDQCGRRRLSATTLTTYGRFVASFNACWPSLTCEMLTPRAVERWTNGEAWNSSTRHLAVSFLKAALNWASSPGKGGTLLPFHPLKGLTTGGTKRRSSAAVVTEGEFARLLGAAVGCPALVDLLRVAWETGCRPAMLRRATAKNLTKDGQALLFDGTNTDPDDHVHKTYKRTGRPLVIPLPPAAAAVVSRLAGERPDGPLFRAPTGIPWTVTNLAATTAYYAAKVGLKGRYTPYSSRHSRATALLEAGVSLTDAAAILGNSPAVLMRNYAHLTANAARLTELMERAKRSGESVEEGGQGSTPRV